MQGYLGEFDSTETEKLDRTLAATSSAISVLEPCPSWLVKARRRECMTFRQSSDQVKGPVILLFDDLRWEWNWNSPSILAHLDLSVAFNTINHSILALALGVEGGKHCIMLVLLLPPGSVLIDLWGASWHGSLSLPI